jgi:cytidine deaminase
MAVDAELVNAAISLIRNRFGAVIDGAPGGAAALRLADGTVLTSVAPNAPNAAVALCHEVGAICEAHKLGGRVVASVCVIDAPSGPAGHWILAPCGVCQERLFAHGPEVEVGVPDLADPRKWQTLRLRDLQPHWFGRVFPDKDAWPIEPAAGSN